MRFFRNQAFAVVFFCSVVLLNAEENWSYQSIGTPVEFDLSGSDGNKTMVLSSPDEQGAAGFVENSYPVDGGEWMEFKVERKASRISYPRRSCVVRIEWYGEGGKPVSSSESVSPDYFGTTTTTARPEFPRDRETVPEGWTLVSDRYEVPADAVKAVVQLHLRWAPGGEVAWRGAQLVIVNPPPERLVTLSAIHTRLSGRDGTVESNREHFRPLIEQAVEANADLIVLPELLNCKGVTHDYASGAEPIPGNTTKFFGALAKQHDLYIVIGMAEKAGNIIYNTAVLLGPDSSIVGAYRKIALPREEIARGISPGDEYPVFETRFGKLGMMICYDVFHPEVARELAANGAEVIAMPIWGGNPALAAARCIENGVHLVTSTYTDHEADWMKSAIWDREGRRLSTASEWESIVTATVDLNKRTYWHGLGDFQARIARESPVRKAEPSFDLQSVETGSSLE